MANVRAGTKAMKRAGNIYPKIISLDICRTAIQDAAQGKKDRRDVRRVLGNLDVYAQDLSERLQNGEFVSPYRERIIKDGLSKKERRILVPKYYPDQCAHHAIMLVLQPVIMQTAYFWSCANIPGRGIDHAAKGVERATKRDKDHARYCLKLDIHHFYQSIPHEPLRACLARRIKDKRALRMLDVVIDSCPEGIPIGNYTSPWFAELYLQPLDRLIKDTGIRHYVRYADDMVLIDGNKRKLRKAFQSICYWLTAHGLEVKDNWQLFRIKTPHGTGRKIDFVGRCFAVGYTTIRKRKALAFMRQSRKVQKAQKDEKPIDYHTAAGFISRATCLLHTQAYGLRKKYLDPVKIGALKGVIRNESKRKLAARSGQCVTV